MGGFAVGGAGPVSGPSRRLALREPRDLSSQPLLASVSLLRFAHMGRGAPSCPEW
jgi:hypothetical protein